MIEAIKNNPVRISTAVTVFCAAFLAVLIAAGVPISDKLNAALLGFVAAIVGLVNEFVRAAVTPTRKLPPQSGEQ